jgi:hypothetical protein
VRGGKLQPGGRLIRKAGREEAEEEMQSAKSKVENGKCSKIPNAKHQAPKKLQ